MAYLSALGRAIALAQNFEHSCKFVFGTYDLAQAFDEGKFDLREWRSYGRQLMKRTLGGALQGREHDEEFSEAEIAALRAARTARNFLAHEAASPSLYVPPKFGRHRLGEILKKIPDTPAIAKERDDLLVRCLREALPQLEKAVIDLAKADDIVSGWSYMIQEKDSHIPTLAKTYPRDVLDWVLEPLQAAGFGAGPTSPHTNDCP